MAERWSIDIQKDYLKFSAAHFLIFPDGTAERLHGHNYKVYTQVESALDPHGLVLNFKEIKPLVKQVCDELDEHLLVPGQHPVLRCQQHDDGTTEVVYQDRRYRLPTSDVIVLPITNTSAENLATWVGRQVRERLARGWPRIRITAVRVGVEESPGQRGVYAWDDGTGAGRER
jgi:6-pyruvoyltetrahydropterin/6-carboxytetrahydropterin synthase